MSVYIKGMKMPKNCLFCPMSHWNKLDQLTGCEIVPGKKHIPESDADFWGHDRPDWCPLVEIPPHGRLGDLDALKEKVWDADTRCVYVQVVDLGDIEEAPTIIPAEREEEKADESNPG